MENKIVFDDEFGNKLEKIVKTTGFGIRSGTRPYELSFSYEDGKGVKIELDKNGAQFFYKKLGEYLKVSSSAPKKRMRGLILRPGLYTGEQSRYEF